MTSAPRRRRPFFLHRRPLRKHAAGLTLAVFAGAAVQASAVHAMEAAWPGRLQAELAQVDKRHTAGIGVYVRDLDTGVAVSHRGEELWYLASMVKVPVALTVLRSIERGEHTLDTQVTLRAADYVDGTGHTNDHAPGTRLSVRYLLEQMIVFSDNTASDMLIDLVGINEVNALTQALVPDGFQRLTSLADVRRQAYANLAPAAMQLSGTDFLALKAQRSDADRLRLLSTLIGTPTDKFRMASVNDAFGAYYATNLNSARLDAYADLLALLIQGKALDATHTAYLLGVMRRVQTGQQRIKAGLPPGTVYAHKTGTQRARICDAGIITTSPADGGKRVIVVACARGDLSLARSESALKDVGEAIRKSGLLFRSGTHESAGDTVPLVPARAGPAGR